MSLQLSIFDKVPRFNRHKGNQEILDSNREHYGRQTDIVLSHLLKGERVTGLRMMELHRIQDIRPRIAAIIKMGYNVQYDKVKGGHGAKEWYLVKTKDKAA